jgi:hypothetical protein
MSKNKKGHNKMLESLTQYAEQDKVKNAYKSMYKKPDNKKPEEKKEEPKKQQKK